MEINFILFENMNKFNATKDIKHILAFSYEYMKPIKDMLLILWAVPASME